MSVAGDLLRRIELAVLELDIGVSRSELQSDFLRGANIALLEIGGGKIKDLGSLPALRRAATQLEDAT